jgi:hypothetical protein
VGGWLLLLNRAKLSSTSCTSLVQKFCEEVFFRRSQYGTGEYDFSLLNENERTSQKNCAACPVRENKAMISLLNRIQ